MKSAKVNMSAFEVAIQLAGETFAFEPGDQAVMLFWSPDGEAAQDRGVAETEDWAIYVIEKNPVVYPVLDLEAPFSIHWKTFTDVREVVLFGDESLVAGTRFAMFGRDGNRIRFTNLADSHG